MIKPNQDTDPIIRSLLQKAIRRGNYEITSKALAILIKNNDLNWLRNRLAVITFEECWTYSLTLSYEDDIENVARNYFNLVGTVKNRNASGLGSLAFNLAEGDNSVFEEGEDNRAIRIIAEAQKRPKDFWNWIKSLPTSQDQINVINKAERGYFMASWPWDKAFTLAAAYLSIFDEIPKIQFSHVNSDSHFPIWVSIDKHTPAGKIAIKEAAKKIGLNPTTALWLSFYFESAKCNSMENSSWWDRELNWRMKKMGLRNHQASEIWEELKQFIIEFLGEEISILQTKLNNTFVDDNTFKSNQLPIFNH